MAKSKYIRLREYAMSNREELIKRLNAGGLTNYETGLLTAYDDMIRMSYIFEGVLRQSGQFEVIRDNMIKKLEEMDSRQMAEKIFHEYEDYKDIVCDVMKHPCKSGHCDNCIDCIELFLKKEK